MQNPPAHFVVFVPGYMGSRLRNRRTGELVWLDIAGLLKNPFDIPGALNRLFDQMRYPNDDLVPDGIVDDVVFLPPLFKLEQYSRLLNAFQQMGYTVDGRPGVAELAVYTFAYDWRQDNRISARQLGDFIEQRQKVHPGAKAVLIGHSNGGIVSRWYIEKEGGGEHVLRLILLASPWDGAPKAFQVLQEGLEVFLLRMFTSSDTNLQEKIRKVILSFPSYYQLIPAVSAFVHSQDDSVMDPFKNSRWLDNDRQRQMLLDGRQFNIELGSNLSVETLCIFGVKHPTTTGCKVRADTFGLWTGFEWERDEDGDGTVTLQSAVHPKANQKLPFTASHGDIYVAPAVLEKLEFELITQYRVGAQAQATTPRLSIHFDADRSDYLPAEPVRVWATVHLQENHAPVYGAKVEAAFDLSKPLPGFPAPTPAETVAMQKAVRLAESGLEPGRYEAILTAPAASGYYRLVIVVEAVGEAPVHLEELVLIEGAQMRVLGAAVERGWLSPGEPTGAAAESPVFRSWDMAPAEDVERGPYHSTPEPAAPSAVSPAASGDRYINASIAEHPANQPLPFGRESTLEIFVDERMAAAAVRLREDGLFAAGETLARLQLLLTSDDFVVYTRAPQELRVPISGRSRNKARFDIEPRHSGVSHATVLVYKNNNFIQGIDLELNVENGQARTNGGPAIQKMAPIGRPVENLAALQPRDVLLFIKNRGDAFDLTLVDQAVTEARLPISLYQLNGMVARARQALRDVVYMGQDASGVASYTKGAPPANVTLAYQADIDIPAAVHAVALRRLAEEGLLLYQDLFYGPSAGADARQLGERLRQLAHGGPLKLQIVSQHFFLPWGMLYLGDDPEHPDPENFLGMRHVLEHIPLQASPPIYQPEISSFPALSVSLNLDPSIDQAMGADFVARQVNYWQTAAGRGNIQLAVRQSDQEWLQAMKEPSADQLLYFYGHAVTPPADDPAGPDGAALSFADQRRVSLRDLRLRDPQNRQFPGQPLVFINACESAELSPLFYGGFMPYFTSKGARGMIGTECEVPAVFAAEWARRFFQRFLYQEQSVGRTFLDLRREFYRQHNNLLGLLYALYCDGDTRVSPPLAGFNAG